MIVQNAQHNSWKAHVAANVPSSCHLDQPGARETSAYDAASDAREMARHGINDIAGYCSEFSATGQRRSSSGCARCVGDVLFIYTYIGRYVKLKDAMSRHSNDGRGR